LLTVENVSKRYSRRWVLRDLTFELGKGDRLAVLGHNGSGKSTLMRILAGLLAPSTGKVIIAGDTRRTLGYCALEQSLYAPLTTAEHLHLAADLRGCEARESALLDLVGLSGARDLHASELSTGMKARLKLALAIQTDPQVLILDEPGASLDEMGRSLVERIVEQQADRGCLVFATNDPAERRLANLELRLEN
jgi:ABC-type multidrug transport system ATPase subunit